MGLTLPGILCGTGFKYAPGLDLDDPGFHHSVLGDFRSQLPPGENPAPRPPMAFQDYLDQHDIKRLRSWRAVS